MRVIKRYPNRKLYDTYTKEYINLKGVAALIQEDQEIRIVDNATGEDLTSVTLTQIILNHEKEIGGIVPRSFLAGLIQQGGERLAAFQNIFIPPIGLKHYVEQEIILRTDKLIETGEITTSDAEMIREKLLAQDSSQLSGEHLLIDEYIFKLLETLNIPSKDDLKRLKMQLENLADKLDNLK